MAAAAFAGFGPNDAPAIGETSLTVSPDGGRMYPADVERSADRIAFKVKRCPLKDAWIEAGVGQDKLATLCRIAGAFDRGLFEATGIRFDNVTWTGSRLWLLPHRPDEQGCRLMHVAVNNPARNRPCGDRTRR
ncbi:L-2-amino-thiazoline-4-carboxylic acid hydrolase [Mesorhizobium sanjuanii]|uniref:L-2-amino-thiazoline-4-carboxylic acid hydrolase n=1 Tax=Mesorhizobium sanjuanii TaxID=2037900 RepID=UPI001FDF5DF4|nr:L-2-amino-thiazoline-4-carboxylic acid hydrolase [Mesorhizobium sanjuanii]